MYEDDESIGECGFNEDIVEKMDDELIDFIKSFETWNKKDIVNASYHVAIWLDLHSMITIAAGYNSVDDNVLTWLRESSNIMESVMACADLLEDDINISSAAEIIESLKLIFEMILIGNNE